MPPTLACQFTTGQLSALRIVSDEIRERGRCTLYVDEIAARAGVSRRHAQGALREAERLELVRITERRVSAFRNDSNVVTIVSAEWLTWLGRQGAKNFHARPVSDSKPDAGRAEGPKRESGGLRIASPVPRSPP
jgi:hypothetical protein